MISALKKIVLIFLLSILFSHAVYAADGIMVYPLRLEIPADKRSTVLTIMNRSKTESVIYNINTIPMRMKEDGSLYVPEKMTKREMLAKSMVKFSPRTATINKNGKQVVRIIARKPPNLPDGEYLTYLRIGPVSDGQKFSAAESQAKGININLMVGMRIPLTIYQGSPSVKTTIKSLKLINDKKSKHILLSLKRDGNMSSYVGAQIYSVDAGSRKVIAARRRIVTFLPLTNRSVLVPLQDEKFKGGKVLVELTDYKNKKVIDSKYFNLR